MAHTLRDIPSVHRVLRDLGEQPLPRPLVLHVIRRELDDERRTRRQAGEARDAVARVRATLDDLHRARLRPVINGTGVILHTNFGRSPLAPQAVQAVAAVAEGYSNVEYDLIAGARGGRAAYLEAALAALCGAEAATVVNNCAAALVLALHHFASRDHHEVIVSRGELVQIGGGFRVPEILEAAGATLREVGTTNRTVAADYERAIGDGSSMILRVHRSNFYMDGFVRSATTAELADVAQRHRLPLVEDLGSGALFDTGALGGGEHEPTPHESLAAGADLVCFSGDKLLGGPQAGIIAGRAGHVAALKREPLFRALRCDKLVLAALQATVDLHLADDDNALPIDRMMHADLNQLRQRAQAIAAELGHSGTHVTIGTGESQVGGGTLPRTRLTSAVVHLRPRDRSPQCLAKVLREGEPPVVGRVTDDAFSIDLRTIPPQQDAALLAALTAALRDPIGT